MEQKKPDCVNKRPCSCAFTNCPRHGRCCECVAYHRSNKDTPMCFKK